MEVITGSHHADLPMGSDASRVGEARRHAAQLALACGLDEVEAGKLALVVTELSNNLLRHATGGRLLLAARPGRREVEVLAVDSGPGIHDVARSLGDGYSTFGTAGTGLGAVRRLASEFDIHSSVPQGTIVLARVRSGDAPPTARQSLQVGAISLAMPGQRVCGDDWACMIDGPRVALLVADGLGHGPDAAEAAARAVEVFREDPTLATPRLLERTHERLRASRGAAVALLQADGDEGSVRLTGAGNVIARLVPGRSCRRAARHGRAPGRDRRPA